MDPSQTTFDVARMLARHFNDIGAQRPVRWRTALNLNNTALLIVHVALSANLAHISIDDPAGAGLAIDDSRRRPISLMSISNSMRVPFETIRRQAIELQRRGMFQKMGTGWIVPAKLLTDATGNALVEADAAALVGLVGDLARLGAASAQAIDPGELRALPPDLVVRLWNDFSVKAMEWAVDLCGSALDPGLFMTIIRMNVQHITTDPERSRGHAAFDTIPTDRDRRPVTLRALARAEQQPYPTVRRRVAAMVARGVVEETAGGLIVPARVLGNEAMSRSNVLNVQRVAKLFADLKRLCDDAAMQRDHAPLQVQRAGQAGT